MLYIIAGNFDDILQDDRKRLGAITRFSILNFRGIGHYCYAINVRKLIYWLIQTFRYMS